MCTVEIRHWLPGSYSTVWWYCIHGDMSLMLNRTPLCMGLGTGLVLWTQRSCLCFDDSMIPHLKQELFGLSPRDTVVCFSHLWWVSLWFAACTCSRLSIYIHIQTSYIFVTCSMRACSGLFNQYNSVYNIYLEIAPLQNHDHKFPCNVLL